MDKEHCGYDQPGDNQATPASIGEPLGATSAYSEGAPARSSPVYTEPGVGRKYYSYDDQPPEYSAIDRGLIQTEYLQNSDNTFRTIVVQESPSRPPSYMWLSCLVYWLCSCICGLIAMAYSHNSETAASENKMDEARRHGNNSLYASGMGIAIGILVYIMLIIHWTVLRKDDNSKSSHYDY